MFAVCLFFLQRFWGCPSQPRRAFLPQHRAPEGNSGLEKKPRSGSRAPSAPLCPEPRRAEPGRAGRRLPGGVAPPRSLPGEAEAPRPAAARRCPALPGSQTLPGTGGGGCEAPGGCEWAPRAARRGPGRPAELGLGDGSAPAPPAADDSRRRKTAAAEEEAGGGAERRGGRGGCGRRPQAATGDPRGEGEALPRPALRRGAAASTPSPAL